MPHPGISNSHNQRLMFRNPQYYASSERKYYPYYQWICFVLFMQGVCFYLPHYMWKSAEGGLMRHLSTGELPPSIENSNKRFNCCFVDLKFAPTDEEEQEVKNRALSNYLLQHFRLFNGYAYKYCLFELLCLLNAIGQFALTDLFLQGHFRWFGWNVLGQSQLAQYWKSDLNSTNETASSIPEVNTMTYIFPRMTKCIFHYFGTSGDVQRSDALCLLPLNVFHEKIYLFIWFWFVAIIALSIAVLLIRLVMLVVPPIRLPLLKSRCQNCSTKHLRVICNKGNFGDYFLFYRLSKNIDTIVMESVIYQVGKSLLKQKHHINNKLPDEQFRRTGSLDRIYDPNNRYIIE